MNGEGWVCDECSKTKVLPALSRYTEFNEAPRGWYVLLRPTGPETTSERWDFCDIECVMNHAIKQEAERAYEEQQKASLSARKDPTDLCVSRGVCTEKEDDSGN